MRKLILSLAATPLILGSIAVSANAADDAAVKADSGFNIFSDVKFKAQLRTRYQHLDFKALSSPKAGPSESAANILTNRTNLNMSAKLFEVDGLNAEMELNAVNDFGTQSTNGSQVNTGAGTGGSKVNGYGEASVAKISQANISYTAGGVTGIVGRKGVNLDNQRFIGTVGWKQNMQTYDLVAAVYGIGDFNIIGAYVFGVNAIGDDGYDYGRNPEEKYNGIVGSGRTNSALVNASYKIMDPIKVTGYAYLLGSASDTYGVSATGKVAIGDSTKLTYRAEVAMQTAATLKAYADGVISAPPAGHNDSIDGDAGYMNLDVGANISGFLVGLNYEVLGGADKDDKDTSAFQTHLATKHKFNGWADQFLGTPSTGLADLNVRGGYKFDTAGKIIAIYHMFGAAADGQGGGSQDGSTNVSAGDAYGQEFDIAYSTKIPGVNNLGLLVKAAMYMDDEKTQVKSNDDVTMAWVQLDYKFSTK